MTGPLYPNQPCIEVATEIRFQGELKIEDCRSKFQDIVRNEYSVLSVPGAMEGVAPALQPYRFETENRESGIQLAVNSFSCYSRDYPGHQIFIPSSFDLLDKLISLIGDLLVTRVGWRYINAIPFTREGGFIPLSNFFMKNEIFGDLLSRNIKDIDTTLVVTDEKIDSRVVMKSAHSKDLPSEEVLILDIDSYLVFAEVEKRSSSLQIKDYVEDVHLRSLNIFKGLLSEEYESFLKGGSDE